jgi:GxxExxY protein
MPLNYEGPDLDIGYRLDLLVGGLVIVEVKAIDALAPIHTAQLLTYLRLSRIQVGLLMNFNVALFKSGLKRVVN